MLKHLLLLTCLSTLANSIPRQRNAKVEDSGSKPLLLLIEQTVGNQQSPSQQTADGKSTRPLGTSRQQQVFQSPLPYGGEPYFESQFQYPGFNFLQEKHFSRVQPQIVFYGPAGQGQPILINPGSPPGNFLVPQQPQPGPDFVIRKTPQRPVFVAGYPKPAHIPPIEMDAEEVPTNPAKIPPLASGGSKPEKLETFNEGKNEYPSKSAGEGNVQPAAGRHPQLIPNTNLKPGQRFFILNGEELYQSFPFQNYPEQSEITLKYAQQPISQDQSPINYYQQLFSQYQQPDILQKQRQEIDFNAIPSYSAFLRNAATGPTTDSEQNYSLAQNNGISGQRNKVPKDQEPKFPQNLGESNPPLDSEQSFDILRQSNADQNLPQNFASLHQAGNPQEIFFRSNLPLNFGGIGETIDPVGRFRFAPPSDPYFSLDGEDIENDSIVINAKVEEGANGGDSSNSDSDSGTASRPEKTSEPSTAQAAPGAIALAGPGGLAGASPKATALVGKGGLAVSSPEATAIAGANKNNEKKSSIKSKNK